MNSNSSLMELLMEMFDQLKAATPKVLGAIAIVIIGYIISKWISKILRKFLEKTKIDAFADKINSIDIIEKSNFKLVPSKLLAKVLYYILFLITLIVAADTLKMAAVTELILDIINFIPKLIAAIVVLALGIFISDAIRKMVLTACKSLNIPAAKIIAGFIFYFLLVNILMTALKQVGIPVQSLSQNVSILLGGLVLAFGIGYGFASKDIFANILSSYYYNNNINVGDKVTIGSHSGLVKEVSRNHLIIRKEDDSLVHIPIHKLNSEDIIIHNS